MGGVTMTCYLMVKGVILGCPGHSNRDRRWPGVRGRGTPGGPCLAGWQRGTSPPPVVPGVKPDQ